MAGFDGALERALGVAFRYLNRRERTVEEVRSHLAQKGLDTAMIDAALARLIEDGYLDDARFARLFAQDKRELEQWGADRIARALRDRGIEPGLIDAAIAVDASGSELDRALALLRQRFSSVPRERRERDRALGVLLRKGYDGELALEALAAYARDAEHASLR